MPGRKRPPEPSALDRLDPAPQEQRQPRPPRAPRRRVGEMEKSVKALLADLPPDLRKNPIAAGALRLARELDAIPGDVFQRDDSGHVREIRQCVTQLHEWSPGVAEGDKTDEGQRRREERLLRVVTGEG